MPERPGQRGRHRQPPPVLLLHGLAGHMGEWDALTELLLADGHRVVAYDARGHGASTRRPSDMTRAACVRDAVAVIRALDLAPVTLVGQSLGGHTAMLTAAAYPDLVHALILVEAGPGGPNPDLPAQIGGWVDGWPTPFKSLAEAENFFGNEAWARVLDERPDGWHARVDRDVMVSAVAELATHAYWDQWERVRCPALVVRGANGTMPEAETTEMRARRPGTTQLAVIPDTAHDVHLDQPTRLHAAATAFLADVEGVAATDDAWRSGSGRER
ncbi:alpha/beta fold hydrolase [Streptomyces himalayensis]|uniref:Alpha/beta hydrolase n=1 Tax=Streptomyces himalayensis subsp. himalayensis TaxID=2756131 RepID=A0A7W0DS37_9ACTN|nr:alpha/beta hydrolase [Streptomyces himalayensis]MBA2949723.1 alpha/beta hydrolase [Streptomyces himalayensis subsp. himalayensis]